MVTKVQYSRGINQCNMIITAEEDSEIEKDSIEMFRYNEIPYFLKFYTQKKDNVIQFYYDITGMQPLEQALESQSLNYQFVKKILDSFDQACIQAENYMLVENDIVLLPELLYLNTESSKIRFCYLPGNQIHICVQFKKFMEYLMRHLDHKDKQAVQLVYGVYQQVAEEKSALHSALRNAENEWKQIACNDDTKDISYRKDTSDLSEKCLNNILSNKDILNNKNCGDCVMKGAEIIREEKHKVVKKRAEKKFINFFRKKIYVDSYQKMEDEIFFEEESELPPESSLTINAMSDTNVLQNRFIYQGTDRNRDFICPLGKKVLGSSVQYADICIPFPMVSKVHARIEVNEKGTFLEDMNSANGTQVNGETLKYREKRILQKGDIVNIAGESYSFC